MTNTELRDKLADRFCCKMVIKVIVKILRIMEGNCRLLAELLTCEY